MSEKFEDCLNLEINNDYVIDLDKLMAFVTDIDSEEQFNNTTVTQTYGVDGANQDISLLAKEITENRLNMNDTLLNFRYDMVKDLLSRLLDVVDVMTRGQGLAFNSLVCAGIIKRKN